MGLEEILKDMERGAWLRLRELESDAETKSRSVIADAEKEATQLRESHLASAQQRLVRERERLFSVARLEAQRELAAAREAWLDHAFAKARERLAHLRNEPPYAGYLERLTQEVVAELGSEIKIEIDPKDETLMRRIVSALDIKADIAPSLKTFGGLRAGTPDGCIRIVNTVEARLARARGDLRQRLAKLLSSEEVPWQATTATATPASGP
ncbi:MAG: hypothetical protein HYV04_04340 [Deltaproteobacteria bacterium]|nr:hypothetical protein [Deltaproteobacteria bacterium]